MYLSLETYVFATGPHMIQIKSVHIDLSMASLPLFIPCIAWPYLYIKQTKYTI